MRTEVQVFLEIMRVANRKTSLPAVMMDILREAIPMTRDEFEEVAEILTAELREKNATYPGFREVNDEIARIKAQGK